MSMCTEYTIRQTTQSDLEEIAKVYEHARQFMKKSGNPRQWGDSHPSPDILEEDAVKGTGRVIESDGKIIGCFAVLNGPDPTYSRIYDGEWLNDEPYIVIHRVASSGTRSGVMKACLDYCEKICRNIRIDTHRENRVMQHQLHKYGFTYCGTIYEPDGTPRMAYQRFG